MRAIQYLFEHIEKNPKHVAVEENNISVSYEDFGKKVFSVANVLNKKFDECKVLIMLPAGTNAYASMFGALVAGGFYSPANLNSPDKKIEQQLHVFDPDVIIVDSRTKARFRNMKHRTPFIDIEEVFDSDANEPEIKEHELAYVMFTSGSTGVPKGVMIKREALDHYVEWALNKMAVTPADRWSQHPNIAFDLSVLDIYGALCGGATLVPILSARHRLLLPLAIQELGLSIWNSVPSAVDLMIQSKRMTAENLRSLRLMTFCGEPLLKKHLDAIFKVSPDVTVHNTYGPTEATVSFTLLPLRMGNYHRFCDGTVALGDPIDGMGLQLSGGSSPDEGEVLISGPQLAKGYWKNNGLTAKAFTMVDVNGEKTRVYHTGDWAVRKGESLYFRGRMDDQVKVAGYRLELNEINVAIIESGIEQAATVYVDNNLHAFIVNPKRVSQQKLISSLNGLLDKHAIPKYFHPMDALPRNENDKVNLSKLRELATNQEIHVEIN